ncbi:MAG TPA: hypothetical protein VFL83_14455 [Anaeromyxobacter sp.]|nr:hypothetical protein [Anaeromyxobacter sp.]
MSAGRGVAVAAAIPWAWPARAFGPRMGADVARGPEEWALHAVFGNAWR